MAQSRTRTGTVISDGYELAYLVEGDGPHRMLVIGSAIYYPRVFSQALRDRLQIAFVDHRGFARGPESGQAADFMLSKIIDDVELLRVELGWDEFIVAGHSGHGFMALEYAKAYSEHVSHVVLMNVGPSYGRHDQGAAERDWEELVAPERKAHWAKQMESLGARIEAAPEDRFLLFMLAMGARSWYRADFDAAPLWKDVPINLAGIDHIWGHEFATIDIAAGLRELNKPVLLIMGLWDYLVPPLRTWERVRPAFRDLTVRVFPRSGHSPMLEEPETFDAVLTGWLSDKS